MVLPAKKNSSRTSGVTGSPDSNTRVNLRLTDAALSGGESVCELVSGVKGRHFGLSTPAADDTNSRFDNILPGLGLNRAATLDQESPGSIPGGATPSAIPR